MSNKIVIFAILALCCSLVLSQTTRRPPRPGRGGGRVAFARLRGNKGVFGGISFVVYNGTMYIRGAIANISNGLHGFHIHSSGNTRNNCANIGDHYNPYNRSHGCNPQNHHWGDLGNVNASNRVAFVSNTIPGMTLAWSNGRTGNRNPGVQGLAIAVDTNPDDCRNENSGGPPLACGRILPLRRRRRGLFDVEDFELFQDEEEFV